MLAETHCWFSQYKVVCNITKHNVLLCATGLLLQMASGAGHIVVACLAPSPVPLSGVVEGEGRIMARGCQEVFWR